MKVYRPIDLQKNGRATLMVAWLSCLSGTISISWPDWVACWRWSQWGRRVLKTRGGASPPRAWAAVLRGVLREVVRGLPVVAGLPDA